LTLPGGETLPGEAPVVVIGPNGSGKTRQAHQMTASVLTEFINALRNTRVAPELPAVGVDTARNQFNNQKNHTRGQHWELASDFDYMLSQLLAQQSMVAIEFVRRYQADPATAGSPEETPLTRVERLWGRVFPGRELHWRDWKPLIKNSSTGAEVEYSGNEMSDGEKAALYLAGRVFSMEAGILVVDEPETHFHSLLAVGIWNALEDARPDIRFVYVTHDLTFAMSRRNPRFVLANPLAGLRSININSTLPDDVAELLLGSASLSFYASRVAFCEGDATSLDVRLYGAWFSGPDTVVRPVGSCQRVIRCVDALANSGITAALTAIGLVDGDYLPDAFISELPAGTTALKVHEVESLLCLPPVVSAICSHVSQPFEESEYRAALRATISAEEVHQVIIERWKQRMGPHLEGLVAGISKRRSPVADLILDLPNVFDQSKWNFSPEQLLKQERDRVDAAASTGSLTDMLSVIPGKQFLPVAASQAGMNVDAYVTLVIDALSDDASGLKSLGAEIESALAEYLPQRYAPVRTT
jgi:hypothetical protein